MTKNNMIKSEDMHVRPSVYPSEGVKRYLPEVRVSFHTEAQCYQATGRKLVRGEVRDPTYQLLSVSTTKTLDNPAGGFTITLAGDQWAERLTSNDLVVIRMGYIGQDNMNTVMIGLIDRVRTRRSAQGGKPNVQTVVVGRDFGKMLLKSQLKFYPEIGAQPSAEKYFLTEQGWIKMLGIFTEEEFVEGTPKVILEKIMTEVLPKLNDTQWTVYDETKSKPTPKKIGVTNLMGWQFETTDFFIPFYLTADTFEGSIWNLMERATQKPFTELFVDTVDNFGIISDNTKNVTASPVASNTQPSTIQATAKIEATAKDEYYTVVKGDTLWGISGRYYKNSSQWRQIWDANKSMLIERDKRNSTNHGHWIYPGQKLRIPGVKNEKVIGGGGSEAVIKPVAPVTKPYPKNTQDFGYDNGKVMVTYRMTPFDAGKWNSLPMHTLEAVDVLEEDVGRSDDEHYNVFWAGSTVNPLGDMNIRMVSPPVMNIDDVSRYGISPLEVEIEGLAIKREQEKAHKVALENLSNKYSKILQSWYQNNHKYYEGTITTRGIGGYRVGQRLDYKPLNIEAYIEGVVQTFNVFSDWSTSLTITRGVKKPTAQPKPVVPNKPVPATQAPKPTPPGTSEAVAKDQYYTVVKGDTLWGIASKYYGQGTKWGTLWDANKSMLIERDPRNSSDPGHWIYPGQKLRIPKG